MADITGSFGGKYGKVGGQNAFVLAACHGLFTCAISIDLTLTGLAGYQLAPDKTLATLPFALITVAGAIATLFASHLLQRFGLRLGFAIGSLMGAAGGLLSVWAVFHKDFFVFCLGTAAVGVYQAFSHIIDWRRPIQLMSPTRAVLFPSLWQVV